MTVRFSGLPAVAAAAAALELLATPASAADLLNTGGFGAGWAGPLTGLVPLLGFVAIGLWAARWGGASIWQMPLAAMAGAVLGGLAAGQGLYHPGAGVAAVLAMTVLGFLVAVPIAVPAPLVVTGFLAAAQGFAGSDARGDDLAFWSGYSAAALLAMSGGMGLTGIASRLAGAVMVRVLGFGIAAVGVLIVTGRL